MTYRRRLPSLNINLAPLIDIVFILLIFFSVSMTVLKQSYGVKLDLPVSKTANKEVKGITISIDKANRVFVNKKEVGRGDLIKMMKAAIKKDPNVVALVRAHKLTSYEFLISVLDDLRQGGGFRISLQAEKPK